MNKFRNKRFNGAVYTFTHLDPMGIEVEPRNTSSKECLTVKIDIRFSHHCFTVEFKDGLPIVHHPLWVWATKLSRANVLYQAG